MENEAVETPGAEVPQTGTRSKARPLSAAALRALAEADARRAALQADRRPPEVGGRAGLDPIRYGDWEVKGIASDF